MCRDLWTIYKKTLSFVQDDIFVEWKMHFNFEASFLRFFKSLHSESVESVGAMK